MTGRPLFVLLLLLLCALGCPPGLALRGVAQRQAAADKLFAIHFEPEQAAEMEEEAGQKEPAPLPRTTPRATTTTSSPPPPPYWKPARMARYVAHHSQWASVATICSRAPIQGFPFANVFSIADGTTQEDSSGTPYFYLTPLELSVQDLKKNTQASMTMSLAQGSYCDRKNLDPEDPRCVHIILTGNIKQVEANSTEEAFAQNALFTRHPDMDGWPKDHGWFFAKMHIINIRVLDFFGGAKNVTVEDYYKATPY